MLGCAFFAHSMKKDVKMENNESKFSEILEDIKYRARLQGGYISKEDVEASFESMDLSNLQKKFIVKRL